MIDNMPKTTRGDIRIELLDDSGNVVDFHEKRNMIMASAREDMAELMGGVQTGKPINKIVLGTQGHKDNNILTPKGEDEGFILTRTQLFSEESGDDTYTIEFTNGPLADAEAVVDAEDDAGSTVHRVQEGSECTWTITIPKEAGNHGGLTPYTEAAFYTGDRIFSMKTFPAKVKDNTVTLRVIWKITF